MEGPTPYILDIVIQEAEMGPSHSELETPLWFILTADGFNSEPIQSTQAIPGPNPKWNFPVRMILSIVDITRAYLYVTLATYKVGGGGIMTIARSRIRLKSMPDGTPKKFRFPLMDSNNSACVASTATFIATLSSISVQPVTKSNPYPFPPTSPYNNYLTK